MDNTPTKARHIVTAFAVALAVITYMDRVGISVAAPLIREDLKLTTIQMGWALSAFGWAYTIFEIPWWLARRQDRAATRPHEDRHLVVVLHCSHRLGVESVVAVSRSVPCSAPERLAPYPQPDAHLHDVAAGQGTRARPGYSVDGDAPEWCFDTIARRHDDLRLHLAPNVSDLRCDWRRSGRCSFFYWYRDSPAEASKRKQSRACVAAARQGHGDRARVVPWGVIFSNP